MHLATDEQFTDRESEEIVAQLLESFRCFGASANMNLSRYPSASRSPMSSFVQSRVGRFCSSSIRPC